MMDVDEQYKRGLETKEDTRRRVYARQRNLQVVLEEQARQMRLGSTIDQNIISSKSRIVTDESQLWALDVGLQDQKEAFEVYSEEDANAIT
jgi:hypothetical protein